LTPEAKAAVRAADITKTDALKLARMEPETEFITCRVRFLSGGSPVVARIKKRLTVLPINP
jgi:hypothetical protein